MIKPASNRDCSRSDLNRRQAWSAFTRTSSTSGDVAETGCSAADVTGGNVAFPRFSRNPCSTLIPQPTIEKSIYAGSLPRNGEQKARISYKYCFPNLEKESN